MNQLPDDQMNGLIWLLPSPPYNIGNEYEKALLLDKYLK